MAQAETSRTSPRPASLVLLNVGKWLVLMIDGEKTTTVAVAFSTGLEAQPIFGSTNLSSLTATFLTTTATQLCCPKATQRFKSLPYEVIKTLPSVDLVNGQVSCLATSKIVLGDLATGTPWNTHMSWQIVDENLQRKIPRYSKIIVFNLFSSPDCR